MSLTYAGGLSITALCPTLATAMADAAIAMAASFNGAAAVNAQFTASPPDLAAIEALLTSFEADVTVAIGASLPSISFSVSDCVSLTANLNAALAALPNLEALLTAAIGIFGYTYAGDGNALGAALTSALATQWPDGTPSSDNCTALVFGLVDNVSLSPPDISTTQFKSYLSGLTWGSGGLTYGGKLTLADICAAVLPATAQATAAINAQLAATATLQANVSAPLLPTVLASITAAAGDLTALPLPSFTVDATASLEASLNAEFAALIALGNIIARYDATAFVYEYTGAASGLGNALTSELASTWGDGTTSTAGACTAVVLGAVDSLTVTTMTSYFGGA